MFCLNEKLVLSWGLNFCVPPPRGINSASVFSEFELLYLQVMKHSPAPSGNIAHRKARLADIVNTPSCGRKFILSRQNNLDGTPTFSSLNPIKVPVSLF